MTLEKNLKYSVLRSFILISGILWLTACNKDDDTEENTLPPLPVDIHISASKLENNQYRPYYFLNGEKNALPYEGGSGAMTNDIVVSDEDVYIAGILTLGETASSSVHRPVIWKNGILEELKISDAVISASAFALAIEGENVYVAGFRAVSGKKSIATVWKNGVARNITDGTNEARLQDVFVTGNDVYAVGYEKNAENTPVAKYWKNGNPVELSDGQYASYAMSIYVEGNDVYVAGYAYEEGDCNIKLWKNGVATNLTAGAPVAMGRKVFVNNDDVYVIGYEQGVDGTQLFAWKNGNRITHTLSKEARSVALDAAVFEDHFFLIGSQTVNGTSEGVLWQDGSPILLSTDMKGISPSGMFVAEK